MVEVTPEQEINVIREALVGNIERLAELGWDETQIRAEVEHGIGCAQDDGLLTHRK